MIARCEDCQANGGYEHEPWCPHRRRWMEATPATKTEYSPSEGFRMFGFFLLVMTVITLLLLFFGCTKLYSEGSPDREREHDFTEMQIKHLRH